MLDTSTKKRIDDCRDILVGKLPDPKAQIEQITIGLIYKFMDDMDKEAIELGGTAKFFSGNFEKFSWDNLFDTKVTANDMLGLYSEAIVSMDKNPNIPQLFRDIFKNAYLPYRDPETLKMFLKTISEFEYTHSEKLGDAFEYLLSVMGSQGDAGQFRTPRHIIDFLVAAVDPSKIDTILDPACGTAGFLISAFKHIKEKNNNELTPDDRKRLIQNFVGYDISPDMVRLSLVNLYLHGFSDPHIWEYDTLSSEERWDEYYDVILANPPFMSPKGGIRPHKKFSISSNRSEVLFVDYIAEHLNPEGRAGIIVPEGVIFQSGTAYKDLRKMLVDNNLYAVVSLPAGVFNPYSGVKTSILLMDKEIAKASEEILFVKIDNDGFGLGAQRNAVKGSQLEDGLAVIKQFKEGSFVESVLAHAVPKGEITKNGDCNLSGERYKTNIVHSSVFEFVNLSEVALFLQGTQVPVEEQISQPKDGYERFIRIIDYTQKNDDIRFVQKKDSNSRCGIDDIIMVRYGEVGFVGRGIEGVYANNLFSITPTTEKLTKSFLFHVFKSSQFKSFIDRVVLKSSMPAISHKVLKEFSFPLPPLSVQAEIVSEIEGYQKIIDGAKMVVENYKPKIDIDAEWEMVVLSKICDINKDSANPSDLYSDWFNYLDISTVENGTGKINYDNIVKVEDAPSRARRLIQQHDILLSTVRPNLKAFGYIDIEPNRFIASTGFAVLTANKSFIEPRFLYFMVFQESVLSQMINRMGKGSYPSINQKDVSELQISLPSLEVQRDIISQLEIEQKTIFYNEKLIENFEQKIKNRIAKVWGE